MAKNSITATKLALNNLDNHLLERLCGTSSGNNNGQFEIKCDKPENVVVFLDMTTDATENVQIFLSASTEAEFVGEGLGDFYDVTTGGSGGGQHYAFGPFESFRFRDVSTGSILNMTICSTTEGAGSTSVIGTVGVKVSAVELVLDT